MLYEPTKNPYKLKQYSSIGVSYEHKLPYIVFLVKKYSFPIDYHFFILIFWRHFCNLATLVQFISKI